MLAIRRKLNSSRACGLLALVSLASLLVISVAVAAESSSGSSTAPKSGATSSSATHTRQSPISAAASLVGAIGSLVPGLISNVAPLVVLFGLGALMMPTLSLGAMGLLRESRRSANDQLQYQTGAGQLPQLQVNPFAGQYSNVGGRPLQVTPQDFYYFTKRSLDSWAPNINSANVMGAFQDLLERVGRAIENADKRYS